MSGALPHSRKQRKQFFLLSAVIDRPRAWLHCFLYYQTWQRIGCNISFKDNILIVSVFI
jgi:hypothetical protein